MAPLSLSRLLLCGFAGGALLLLGVAWIVLWAAAGATFGPRGEAAHAGALFWGIVVGGAGMALLLLAARVPVAHGR
jgi:hypothetical protein